MVGFYDELSLNMDFGNTIVVIYFDFAKAFNFITDNRLAQKLKMQGLEENVCTWITNCLKDRRQMLAVNETISMQIRLAGGHYRNQSWV